MLEGLRAAQKSWAGKSVLTIVMGLIIVSFAIWGIGDIFRGFHGDQVAQVGDITVSATAYRQAYGTELQNLQQRLRRPITNEEAHRIGLDSQVLTRLLSDAVLDGRVRSLGLAISDAQVAKSIRSDPAFAGPGGEFDRSRFASVLREGGYNEQSFVREQRQTDLRQEVIQAVAGGMTAPAAAIDALHRYQTETRSLDSIVFPPEAAGPLPAPSEGDLQGYFDSHSQAFAAPQYRKLVVLGVTPATLAKPGDVTEADARALYDEVKSQRFTQPERRTLQQIVFPSEQEAAEGEAAIKAGQSFMDLAQARKMDAKSLDLGTVTQDQIFDRAVAAAAFSVPTGATSDPVKSAFGSVLVHVVAVEPAQVRSFEDVASTLKQDIANRRAADALRSVHDKIEDARTSGRTLAEAATSAGLEVRTVNAVDASGDDKDGQPVQDLPERDALLKAAFASDVGVDNDTLPTRDGGSVWYEVAAVEPAHSRTLSDVRSRVEAAWRAEETAKRLAGKTEELVKSIDAGQTMDQIASSVGNLPVTHINDAKRSGAPGLPPEAVAKVFDVPVGSGGSSAIGGGNRVLFKILDSVVPPLDAKAPETAGLEERYKTALAEDVLGAYLGKVSAKMGTRVNQDALRASTGASF